MRSASDKLLLLGATMQGQGSEGSLALLDDELSFEPYGIVLPRGDAYVASGGQYRAFPRFMAAARSVKSSSAGLL